ncbi:hypothetical protein [Bacillus timonensis]|uniref:hypothetical protein n=1 Tax=Bacillus timonensis TaxID=1033734 RepID=UPI0011DD6F7D|nr:hypothetical protein [Bacillus timonensis]
MGYNDTLTIERIDKDLDYEPDNCCWITKSENTSRRNIILTGSGKTLRSKFSEQDVKDMKNMRIKGITLEVIAGAFGCSISHVARLTKGEYKYLKIENN